MCAPSGELVIKNALFRRWGAALACKPQKETQNHFQTPWKKNRPATPPKGSGKRQKLDAVGIEPTTFHRHCSTECETKITEIMLENTAYNCLKIG